MESGDEWAVIITRNGFKKGDRECLSHLAEEKLKRAIELKATLSDTDLDAFYG